MASNPNNAVGTNGAFGGRTSVNAFNDVLSIFNSRGIVQGWDMAPDSGMNITIGGDGSNRDVAIAQDNIGNKTTINNISEQPIPLTIPAAPATNSRIDAVVAYVDNPPQGQDTVTDNYGACGLIVVSGTAASSPSVPSEADIRTAITADGGAGTVAYYVVLGTVTVATGTTDISANMLTKGSYAGVPSANISDGAITSSKLANNAVTTSKISNTSVTAGKIDFSGFPFVQDAFETDFNSYRDQWTNLITLDISSFPTGYPIKLIAKGFWVNRGSNNWQGQAQIVVGTITSKSNWSSIPADSTNHSIGACLIVKKQAGQNQAIFRIMGSGNVSYSSVAGQANFIAF